MFFTGLDATTAHIVWIFFVVAATLCAYAREWGSIERVSLVTLAVLLVTYSLFPIDYGSNPNVLSPMVLLSGLGNPALITVLALLVMGEGIAKTGLLDRLAMLSGSLTRKYILILMPLLLVTIFAVSAFLNNVPVVVLAIPIIQEILRRRGESPSKYMMLVSYSAILGGMTTLVGSSTNLLVSGVVQGLGFPAIGFFDFTVLGLMVAGVGMLYVLFIAPRLLPNYTTYKKEIRGDSRHFFAQFMVAEGSRLAGESSVNGVFPSLNNEIYVTTIQRGETAIYAPFDNVTLRVGDELVLSADREHLMDFFVGDMEHMRSAVENLPAYAERRVDSFTSVSEQALAEVMVRPNSAFVGDTLCNTEFHKRTGCIVIGIERQSCMLRQGVTDIPLREGDVLLVQGLTKYIQDLRRNKELLLMDWSTEELPKPELTRNALMIFATAIALSGFGILPPVVAVLLGAIAMVFSKIISGADAIRSLDTKIITLIVTSLALGQALQHTGATNLVTESFLNTVGVDSIHVTLGAFFMLVAVATNILSNQATAVLFTPVGVQLAVALQTPIELFVVAVIIAANCCFATPTGYQTNLLVMAPGHYKFTDYFKIGFPLVVIVGVAYLVLAPLYYGVY